MRDTIGEHTKRKPKCFVVASKILMLFHFATAATFCIQKIRARGGGGALPCDCPPVRDGTHLLRGVLGGAVFPNTSSWANLGGIAESPLFLSFNKDTIHPPPVMDTVVSTFGARRCPLPRLLFWCPSTLMQVP